MAGYSNHKEKEIMARILEVRYTDLDEELRLCQELLPRAQANGDSYAKAFALAYLGDYFIALCDEQRAGEYLLEALDILEEGSGWDDLRLRVFSLLGICYDIRTDEQNAVAYYLRALTLAEKLGDTAVECVVLNNLANAFQQHRCYEEARSYYRKAYQLQADLEDIPNRSSILSNLAEISLALHRYDEAKAYIEECERSEKDLHLRKIFGYGNWCGYYAAIGDKEQARDCAELLLQHQETLNEDRLTAFPHYYTLCQYMMDLGESEYAGRFLQAMENTVSGSLDQLRMLEKASIRYALLFAPPEEHEAAYRRFYERNQQLRAKTNAIIASAMKSQILLDQLTERAEQLQTEQDSLQQEVDRDKLTGVYSRSFMEARMQDKTNRSMGVVILDVDYFKEYNDRYGHLKGDAALKEISACLLESAEEGFYPCRYGGDEFVCICEGATAKEMEGYINRVREKLNAKALPHEASPYKGIITLSIGYAVEDAGARVEAHLMLQLADEALYLSKRSGRNTYTRKRMDVQ